MALSLNARSQYDTTNGDMKVRYDEKIQKCGGIDPHSLKQKDLSINPKDFPKVTLYDKGYYDTLKKSIYKPIS